MDNFSHTDLASELIRVEGRDFGGVCKVSEIELDAESAAKYGKEPGLYVTLETDAITGTDRIRKRRLTAALERELKKLVRVRDRVLIVGLGNRSMTADALGSEVCDRIAVEKDNLKALSPGVAGTTGVESFDVVKGVSDRISPSAVIAVDSLAAAQTGRVCRVVQLCNAGITPGSGVSNHRARLSEQTLGVPVISIGVPLVVYASTIIRDAGGEPDGFENLIVTPKDVDFLVREAADIIAGAINRL